MVNEVKCQRLPPLLGSLSSFIQCLGRRGAANKESTWHWLISCYDDVSVVENPEVSGSKFVLALVKSVIWYLLLVGGDRYSVELVEVHESLLGHHGHKK